ncbi:MAG: M20/M25/M40 family metallo-hydrolase [Gemmatimonadales bacterium]
MNDQSHFRHCRRAAFLWVTALSLPAIAPLHAQASRNTDKLGDEVVARTQEYIRINTTNPPGNESKTTEFFARIFTQEGIPFDSASSAPGRGNIWARLKGGSEPALVLLHHMDVVPADPQYWDVDPFAATIKDGVLYGRGTLDTKSLGIAELEAFLSLQRSKTPLKRDVIFIATADEEAGASFGAGWLVKNHPEAFKGAGMVLNEGGGGAIEDGRESFSIEVTQKVPLWLKFTATGKPGHGSRPPVASAVNRLVRALDRLQTYEFEPRVLPAVDTYFKGLAKNAAPGWKSAYQNIAATAADRSALLILQLGHPELAALLRNACSITMLRASTKINVVPPEAEAQVDCRLLPDQDQAAFLNQMTAIINDPAIRIERIMGFSAAVSPTDNPLYRAIAEVTTRHFPKATVTPAVQTGFTDSHFFRDLGIASYGYAPYLIPAADESGVHGNNERISIENLRRGAPILLEIVEAVARK